MTRRKLDGLLRLWTEPAPDPTSAIRTFALLRWENDRVTEIHVVADELGGLLQLGVLELA